MLSRVPPCQGFLEVAKQNSGRRFALRWAVMYQTVGAHGRVVGNVKRLSGQPPRFRLRVGHYRVVPRAQSPAWALAGSKLCFMSSFCKPRAQRTDRAAEVQYVRAHREDRGHDEKCI